MHSTAAPNTLLQRSVLHAMRMRLPACMRPQEAVMAVEAVHRMEHLEELKRRLQQSDRCMRLASCLAARAACQ